MITLHQFARVWGIPNLSPFCCKVETALRMAGLPYEIVDMIPPSAPRRKLPYITDGEKTVSDSRFILEYLRESYDADLDCGLTAAQRAESLAFQRMLEDDLHWVMMWTRWVLPLGWPANKQAIFGGLPPVVRDVVPWVARRKIRQEIWGQGMGRYDEDQVFAIGRQELDAVSDFLAQKPFFMGDAPTTLDASAFGVLTAVMWAPIESPLKAHALGLANLGAFCERMRDRYFKDI